MTTGGGVGDDLVKNKTTVDIIHTRAIPENITILRFIKSALNILLFIFETLLILIRKKIISAVISIDTPQEYEDILYIPAGVPLHQCEVLYKVFVQVGMGFGLQNL